MGLLEKLLGGNLSETISESFAEGKQRGRRKFPTQPGNLDEEDHENAEKQAENARHDIEPDSLLSASGASQAPIEVLDEEEQVQFLFQSVDLDIDGDDSGSLGYAMVTDSRIVFAAGVLSLFSNEHSNRHSVLFQNISDISIGEKVMTTSLKVRTQGHSYEVSGFDGEVANDAAKYVRQKIHTSETPSEENSNGAIAKLEKLSELHESGALSEDEFEQKKQELLEDI